MAKSKRSAKPIPTFNSEADERRFWETHDTTEYVDWSAAQPARFPNLKPSTETISLRLPAGLLADLKALANKQDVPYQSLLKVFLADRVAREWRASRTPGVRSNKAVQPTSRARKSAKAPKRTRVARG
ncbi:MAG: BrnA antitoxin family protein [Acidobacteriota bacterium]